MLNWVPLPVIHNVQREHVLALAIQNLVADLDDQLVSLIAEPAAGTVRMGRRLLQECSSTSFITSCF